MPIGSASSGGRARAVGRGRAAAAAAIALVALAIAVSPRVTRKMPDLEVYWRAAARARAAQPLYRAEDQHYQFKYLPAFAVLSSPAGTLPLATAKRGWYLVSVALLAALVALAPAMLPERRRPRWLLVTVTVVALAKFLAHEIVLGQVNLLFAVIAIAAVLALRHGREAAGGVLIALAVVVKPYGALFLPWLLARRRPGSIAAAAGALAAILLLPALVYGMPGNLALHADWWTTVTTSTAPNLTNADNVSIAAMFAKWMGPGRAAGWLAAAVSLGLLAFAAAVIQRRRSVPFPEGLEAAVLLTCIPLLSPQGWDYVFLLAAPAIVFAANYADLLPARLRALTAVAVAVVAFSLYDVMGRQAYAAFMSLSIITLCFFVVLAALGALRMRGVA